MRTLRCLHCITDDKKFINDIIKSFSTEAQNSENFFAFVNKTHPTEKITCQLLSSGVIQFIHTDEFLSRINEWNIHIIFLHSIFSLPLNIIPLIPPKIKVVWFGWGSDIYEQPNLLFPFIKIKNFYHKKTLRYLMSKKTVLKEYLSSLLYYPKNEKLKKRILQRIDYFSGVLNNEFDLMRSNNSSFRACRLEYTYDNANTPICKQNIDTDYSISDNILIGNSANPANNHLDILDKLKTLNLNNKKIYIPLSYGGDPNYKLIVKKTGKKIWGSNFITLETFMPYEEYKSTVLNCGNVIMFHERQQAMGNILVSLWYGAKVFLSESSVSYTYLKSIGCKIFSIQKDLDETQLTSRLTRGEIMATRKILVSLRTWERRINLVKNIYVTLEADIKSQIK